jgi:hypothetical protein
MIFWAPLEMEEEDNKESKEEINIINNQQKAKSKKCEICLYKSTMQMTKHIVTKLDASL